MLASYSTKSTWQEALADLITDPKELLEILELDAVLLEPARKAAQLFPLKVPRRFVELIEKGNPYDPLLRQILPLDAENNEVEGYQHDPLQELNANPISGLLHKYHGRVLVTLTSACAVHCRYCFRRNFPYAENNPGTRGWEKIFNYVREDENISEVILSGGDPLAVNDKLLKSFTEQLSLIPHVKQLRLHTRLPIVLPERITDELITWLTSLKFNVVIVVHANHPRELSNTVQAALRRLRSAGATLLNQSVLLKGVNDEAQILIDLSNALFSAGVLPYYLHVLDKVRGTQHFDLVEERAKELHAELLKHLPGYLVPRLAREEPERFSKTLL